MVLKSWLHVSSYLTVRNSTARNSRQNKVLSFIRNEIFLSSRPYCILSDELGGFRDDQDEEDERPRCRSLDSPNLPRREYHGTEHTRGHVPTHFDLCAAVTLGMVRELLIPPFE